jgi:hypothetical protein
MSSSLADEALQLLQDWHHWRPAPAVGAWTLGEWPPTATVRTRTNADEIQHRVWLIMAYLHSMGVRILVSDLLVEYAQALPPILVDYRETLASRDEALLNDALATQNALCADLMTSLSAYLDDFARLKLAMRTIGAQSLLWPLSTLLGVRTVTGERFVVRGPSCQDCRRLWATAGASHCRFDDDGDKGCGEHGRWGGRRAGSGELRCIDV